MHINHWVGILSTILVVFTSIELKGQGESSLPFKEDSITYWLANSRPDYCVPIILKKVSSDSLSKDHKDYLKLKLTEAYRQKREHEKAYLILKELLSDTSLLPYNRAYAYNRLAAVIAEGYFYKGDMRPKMAIAYSDSSITISERYHFSLLKYLSYNEKGYSLRKLGDSVNAFQYIQKAYKGFLEIKNIPNACNAAINLSSFYIYKSKKEEAITLIREVSLHIPEGEYNNCKMRLFLQLAKLYESVQQFDSAYFYLSKGRRLQQDYFKYRMERQINEMSAAYDLQLKEAKIKEVVQENRIQRQRNIFMYFVIALLFLVVLVLASVFYYRRKLFLQTRKRINAENENLKLTLDFKNKELVSSAIALAQQMEFQNQMTERIKEIIKISNQKTQEQLYNLIKEINSQKSGMTWDEFEIRFSQVHEEFYQKLRNQFPNLTPNEIKISAFLRLNLNTKDIAALTNRSPRTIENIRLSIRKKFNIDSDVNLVSFLMDL
jgi:DNA-binding CsgD family transcriptional regulator/predicted Holliday junction resolvase-like endonuclease